MGKMFCYLKVYWFWVNEWGKECLFECKWKNELWSVWMVGGW